MVWGGVSHIQGQFETQREKTYLLIRAPNVDSNQHAHPRNLISLCFSHDKTLHLCLSQICPGKILIRLRMRRLSLIFAGRTCPKVLYQIVLIRVEYHLYKCIAILSNIKCPIRYCIVTFSIFVTKCEYCVDTWHAGQKRFQQMTI